MTPAPGSPIADFWEWWPTVASRFAAVFDGDTATAQGLTPQDIVPELTGRVRAINPDLEWEFGPGTGGARHCLTVTAGGVPGLRPDARRWLDAAPAPDAAWSFADMRLASPNSVLQWDGLTYDPVDCRIGLQAGHSIVHVTLWHPNWGPAKTSALRRGLFGGTGSTEGTAPDLQAGFLMLDAALGEAAVSTWLGSIDVTDESPKDAVTMDDLRGLLGRMAADSVDPEGNPAWTVLRFEQGTARTIVPATPMVAPSCDLHVAVTLPIDPVAASDLTGAQVTHLVSAIEDALDATVKENSAGLLVAVVTRTGEEGESATMHLYLDSAADGVGGPDGTGDRSVLNTLNTVASTWDLGDADVTEEADPSWDAVRAFRV
ncbi:MAG: hypothetical protein ACTH1D_14850 [Mycobacteriaceae bacterium]|uniref:hypothetical protein n=1 Tax=Corynebacterium sp. TaxID=1720 RepID=UPI003F96CADA